MIVSEAVRKKEGLRCGIMRLSDQPCAHARRQVRDQHLLALRARLPHPRLPHPRARGASKCGTNTCWRCVLDYHTLDYHTPEHAAPASAGPTLAGAACSITTTPSTRRQQVLTPLIPAAALPQELGMGY